MTTKDRAQVGHFEDGKPPRQLHITDIQLIEDWRRPHRDCAYCGCPGPEFYLSFDNPTGAEGTILVGGVPIGRCCIARCVVIVVPEE